MPRLRDFSDPSQLAGVIHAIAAGESVDLAKIGNLVALDLAEQSHLAMLDALDREHEADEQCKRLAGGE